MVYKFGKTGIVAIGGANAGGGKLSDRRFDTGYTRRIRFNGKWCLISVVKPLLIARMFLHPDYFLKQSSSFAGRTWEDICSRVVPSVPHFKALYILLYWGIGGLSMMMAQVVPCKPRKGNHCLPNPIHILFIGYGPEYSYSGDLRIVMLSRNLMEIWR